MKTTSKPKHKTTGKPERRRKAAPAHGPARARTTGAQAPHSRLDAVGVDSICHAIIGGETLMAIAGAHGVHHATLIRWIAADAERTARILEARELSAWYFDDQALQTIKDAKDALELQRAREVAHHLRWRASKIAARRYGDRVQLSGSDDLPPIKVDADVTLTPAEAYMRMVATNKNRGAR